MWERIFGTLRAPGKTLNQAAENNLWKEGLLIVIAAAILKGISSVVAAGNMEFLLYLEKVLDLPLADSLQYSPIFTIFSSLFGGLLGWILLGAVFFLFAKLFKGQGTLSGMLAGLGYASSPYFIGAPLAAVTSLVGVAGYILSSIIGLATSIWVLVLNIIAIKESQKISTGAAIATFFIPGILLFILALFLIGIIVALVMVFFGSTA